MQFYLDETQTLNFYIYNVNEEIIQKENISITAQAHSAPLRLTVSHLGACLYQKNDHMLKNESSLDESNKGRTFIQETAETKSLVSYFTSWRV